MNIPQTLPEIIRARKEIVDCESLIASIQGHCVHPKKTVYKQTGANTGNYDPSADTYWTDYHCRICDKMWTEYQ